MRVDREALGDAAKAVLEAAARGEDVIIKRAGEPDLRLVLENAYLALTSEREVDPAVADIAAPAIEGAPERAGAGTAPSQPAVRTAAPKVPPGRSSGPALDDQLAAEELVASIDAHKVGWEPWWKCSLPEVTVVYADQAQLELESRVASAYGWQREGDADEAPRLRGGLAVRLGLAPRREAPNLTVTWTRARTS